MARRAETFYVNGNPRVRVMLRHRGASVRLSNVIYRICGNVGLKRFLKEWPLERLRTRYGFGELVMKEWVKLTGIAPMRMEDRQLVRGTKVRELAKEWRAASAIKRAMGQRLEAKVYGICADQMERLLRR